MDAKKFLLAGYQGKIAGLIEEPLKQPLIELDSKETDIFSVSSFKELSLEEISNYFLPGYQRWGRYGFMGDVICIKMLKVVNNYFYFLDFIGRLSFHKPGLAVDLFTLIKTKEACYFVGIKRKYDPGQGKLAFPGGFIDVEGYHLQTPLETLIHEAEEEIGLKIKIWHEEDLKDYSIVSTNATVDYLGQDINGELISLGTIPTADNEKILSIGLKRVYITTVFALFVDLTSIGVEDVDISESDINNWLKAGDDASSLVIANLKNNKRLEFGLEHHQMIYDENIEHLLFSLNDE